MGKISGIHYVTHYSFEILSNNKNAPNFRYILNGNHNLKIEFENHNFQFWYYAWHLIFLVWFICFFGLVELSIWFIWIFIWTHSQHFIIFFHTRSRFVLMNVRSYILVLNKSKKYFHFINFMVSSYIYCS